MREEYSRNPGGLIRNQNRRTFAMRRLHNNQDGFGELQWSEESSTLGLASCDRSDLEFGVRLDFLFCDMLHDVMHGQSEPTRSWI